MAPARGKSNDKTKVQGKGIRQQLLISRASSVPELREAA